MAKSEVVRVSDVVKNVKSLKDIIQAALRRGWQAAALETIKNYWPYVLIIAVVILLLPVIIFCCLPSILFGWGSSTDPDVSAMNAQADLIKAYYEQYEDYCKERVRTIKTNVIKGYQGGDDTTHEISADNIEYEIKIEGSPMDKNWFIALYSVSTGNDLSAMSEQGIKSFVAQTIPYSVTDKEKPETILTEPHPGEGTTHEKPTKSGSNSGKEKPPTAAKLLTITYQTPEQMMAEMNEEDKNWAQLIYSTLVHGTYTGPVIGSGELWTPFPDVDWRTIMTSEFGYRTDPISGETRFHGGLDLAMPYGTDIRAAKAGTVTLKVYSNSGYGYHIMIDHGGGLSTLYGHCSELLVSEGQHVEQGQLIARVGSTGYSTGPHCHFEVRVDGQQVDPRDFIS